MYKKIMGLVAICCFLQPIYADPDCDSLKDKISHSSIGSNWVIDSPEWNISQQNQQSTTVGKLPESCEGKFTYSMKDSDITEEMQCTYACGQDKLVLVKTQLSPPEKKRAVIITSTISGLALGIFSIIIKSCRAPL